uniref:Transmembrane protein 107 n=1 Tax=Sciurus vulgaris TaxID=55149 RepID=A0A8D2CUF7_SCIVU
MGRISGLVPSRFLTLLAHLVVVITLFWSRDSNIQACLPLRFTPEEYEKQDIQLVTALSVTLGLFAVELAGFFSGVSMFNSTQSLISIGAHCSASVALSFFIFERWECTTYWYIFVFCRSATAATAPPAAPAGEGGPPAPPPNLTSNRRLQQTQAQVDEVVDIMRVNVDKVLERDQKLSELDDRADALQAGASQFETSAAKLKRKYWWKNLKMMIILGVICAIILIIIIVYFST